MSAFVAFIAERFWIILIISSIIGAGLMISGRAVVDEIFLALLLLFGFWAARTGRLAANPETKKSFHWWLFLFTVAYFLIESVRGAILVGDIRILRWVGYYLLFAGFLWLVWKWRFPVPSAAATAKIVGWVSSFYFGVYSLIGLISECFIGIWRWAPQGMLWAGSTYAVFPILFSFPAGIFLLKSEDKKTRRLGWLTLFTGVFAVAYYESRIGWLVLLGMLVLAFFAFRLGRILKFLPGLLIILVFTLLITMNPLATPYSFTVSPLAEPYCRTFLAGQVDPPGVPKNLFDGEWYKFRAYWFLKGMSETVLAPLEPAVSDIDRSLHLEAGFIAAKDSFWQFLFGGGANSYRLSLQAPLQQLYETDLDGKSINPIVRTVGFSAILVDFGFLGVALVVLNIFFVVKALLPSRRLVLIFAVLVTLPWLAVTDLQDSAIYFWSLMPLNLFLFLSRQEGDIL